GPHGLPSYASRRSRARRRSSPNQSLDGHTDTGTKLQSAENLAKRPWRRQLIKAQGDTSTCCRTRNRQTEVLYESLHRGGRAPHCTRQRGARVEKQLVLGTVEISRSVDHPLHALEQRGHFVAAHAQHSSAAHVFGERQHLGAD